MKVARYQFGTLFLGVIALGLLGVAAAALSVRLFKKPEHATTTACVALPCVAWLCIALQTGQGFGSPRISTPNFLAAFLASGILVFVVLGLCSIPVFACIQANVGKVHRYYAASFAGGAIGIPLTLLLLQAGGDLATGSVLLLLTIIPPLVLVNDVRVRAIAAALALAAAMSSIPVLEYLDRRANPLSIYRQSDALSRIDAVKFGPSSAFSGDPSFDERLAIIFLQAGHGGKTRASPIAYAGSTSLNRDSVGYFPWNLYPKKALILGSGAGLELLGALRSGATDIHAVEIDAKVINYINRVAPPTHNPYASPNVKTYIGEGRELAAQIARVEGATFDLVYVPTSLLRGQSSHVFTQNHLVTEEALDQYLGMLSETTGVLAVKFPLPVAFRARMAVAMGRALQRRGVADSAGHLLILEDPRRGTWIMLGRPGRPFADVKTEFPLKGLGGLRVLDVRDELRVGQTMLPFNDDNPFMFPGEMRQDMNVMVQFDWDRKSIGIILVSSVLLTLCVFFLGVRAAGANQRLARSGYLACFTAIGWTYVVYQTLVIQRLSFLFGHPVHATAFILTTTLIASGVGSWLSARALSGDRRILRGVGALVLVLWIVGLSLIKAEWMILPSVPYLWKTLAGIALCAPPFIMMGTYFAVALKRAESEAPGCITWAWGLNGLAAIAGWSFMVAGSMAHGIRFVGVCSALAYGGVGAWEYMIGLPGRNRARALRHGVFAAVVVLALWATVPLARAAHPW